MKKFVAILLVALLALGLATGCGNSGSNNATTGSDSNSSSGSDEVINIKIGHGIPEDTAMHQAWVKFKEIDKYIAFNRWNFYGYNSGYNYFSSHFVPHSYIGWNRSYSLWNRNGG